MKKLWIPILGALVLSGCSGEKGGSLSVVYGITAGLSLILLLGYWLPNKKRDPWLLLLFGSVLVVNVGYCLLSVATDLSWALHANRLSYLGSVFLPIAMLQIILATVKTPLRKWITYTLIALGVVVFLVAASPGYLDIYYRSVQFVRVEGVSRLIKEYGTDPGMENDEYRLNGYPVHADSIIYDPVFTEAAMALEKVGDVSQPVVTQSGVHLLHYLRDIPGGAVELTDEMKAELLPVVQAEAENNALAAHIDELLAASTLEWSDAGEDWKLDPAAEAEEAGIPAE